jgi:hypothetical protein
LFLLALAYAGLMAISLVAAAVISSLPLVHAAAWHVRHGSTVAYDGHLFYLPLYWYPDPDSRPGQLGLQHAQFGAIDINHITLGTEPQKLDAQTAQDKITALAVNLNKRHPEPADHWTTETLQGRKLTFHCMMSSTQGFGETLVCLAADSNLRLVILSTGRARTDALNVLETSE